MKFATHVTEAAQIFVFQINWKENKHTTKLNERMSDCSCFSSFGEPILTLSANSCTPLCSTDIIKYQNKITYK